MEKCIKGVRFFVHKDAKNRKLVIFEIRKESQDVVPFFENVEIATE